MRVHTERDCAAGKRYVLSIYLRGARIANWLIREGRRIEVECALDWGDHWNSRVFRLFGPWLDFYCRLQNLEAPAQGKGENAK